MGSKRKNRSNHYGPNDAPASEAPSTNHAMGTTTSTLPPLPKTNVATFNLTSPGQPLQNDSGPTTTEEEAAATAGDSGMQLGEWQTVKRHKKAKKEKSLKKGKNYPEIVVSPKRLNRYVGISDLQGLVLWLIADGPAPQWLLVKNKQEIRRMCVLMVPGLTMDMFNGEMDLKGDSATEALPSQEGADEDFPEELDEYYPIPLHQRELPKCLRDLAEIFPRVWPIKAAGDMRFSRLHSPLTSFLTSPLPRKQDPSDSSQNKRVKLTDLVMTLDQLITDEYVLHTSQLEEHRRRNQLEETDEDRKNMAKRADEGWVETDLSKPTSTERGAANRVTDGKTVYSLDCEMCMTEDGFELTRISVLDWHGETVYDTLVKPAKPITDYVTAYSGITATMLASVTTTLKDVQSRLLGLFDADTVLIGQSLNSDLNAARFAHPHIIDTSVIYEHTRGPPYKASLKWLAQRFLNRSIQSAAAGHDSIEDACTCLDLVKLKMEKGSAFGTCEENRESIFKRLSRPPHGPRKSAIIDYPDIEHRHSSYASAAATGKDDNQIVHHVKRAAEGDLQMPKVEFCYARLRELELARGFGTLEVNTLKDSIDIDAPLPTVKRDPPKEEMRALVQKTVGRIKEIYEALPKCTAFIVLSGIGDPRGFRRLEELQRRYREEFKVRKWDQLKAKWTDDEVQEMGRELENARKGVGFMVVK